MPTDPELQAEQDAWSQQYDQAEQQKAASESLNGGQQPAPSFLQKWTAPIGRATLGLLDSAVSAADRLYETPQMRKARDVAAGAITGATNIADAIYSHAAGALAEAQQPGDDSMAQPEATTGVERYQAAEPVWDHAKQSILDFRDAVAVQDPSLSDNLVQGVAQLAIPFAGYSRALAGMGTVAKMVSAGALTDATALQPHDARLADLIALHRHTEGKFGEALTALAPDGSALNAYVNYLADRTDESEAEGRFKNVLDGLGANLIATPLIHGAAVVLKQGYEGLRYALDNGVTSYSGFVGPARQQGKIGYHGTPYNPDFFDNSKIGSGEGAQAYGYGHYIAENPETAEHYANTLSANGTASAALRLARQTMVANGDDARKAFMKLSGMADSATHPNDRAHYLTAAQLVKSGNATRGKGNVLQVDIPDEHVDNMMEWGKKLSEQPDIVARLKAAGYQPDESQTGGQFYRANVGEDGGKGLSAAMASQGIPGIKYLDAGSRGKAEGSRNFVVFDGKNIKITGKNGKPVGN